MSLTNISYDNTNSDTNILRYVGDWTINGSYHLNDGESGTLSSTKDESANVTFVFPQPAIAVYYYGIPRCCGGLYAICLDCDGRSPVTNNSVTGFVTVDGTNAAHESEDQGNPIVMWSASFPTPGYHSVILTNQADLRWGGNSQITLDQFVLEVQDSSSDSSLSSSELSTSSISNTVTPSSSTPNAATLQSSSSSVPLGKILGAVFGALAVLSLVLFILFCRYRKRRRSLHIQDLQNSNYHNGTPDPFVVYPNDLSRWIQTDALLTRSGRRKGQVSRYETTEVSPGIRSQKRRYNSTSALARAAPNTVPGVSGSGTGSGSSDPRPGPMMTEHQSDSHAHSEAGAEEIHRLRSEPRRETDAGRVEPVQRDGDDEDDMRTLPPGYEQVFGGGLRSSGNIIPQMPDRYAEQHRRRSRRETWNLGQTGESPGNLRIGLSCDGVQDVSQISLMEGRGRR